MLMTTNFDNIGKDIETMTQGNWLKHFATEIGNRHCIYYWNAKLWLEVGTIPVAVHHV